MSTTGKIKTLFSDKEKTEALFPRTKTSAVNSDDGAERTRKRRSDRRTSY